MRIKKPLLFCLLFFGFTQVSKASHIVGGDITYKYLDSNNYEVTVTLYEDCLNGLRAAINADNPLYINIFDGNGKSIFTNFDSILITSRTQVYTSTENPCFFFDDKSMLTKIGFY